MKTIFKFKTYLYLVIVGTNAFTTVFFWTSPFKRLNNPAHKYLVMCIVPPVVMVTTFTPFFLMRRSYVRELRLYDGKLCTKCGYTLDIESDHKPCPECGVQVDLVAFRAAWLKAVVDWPKPTVAPESK